MQPCVEVRKIREHISVSPAEFRGMSYRWLTDVVEIGGMEMDLRFYKEPIYPENKVID